MLELLLEDHHGTDDLVERQQLSELLPVASAPHVAPVFQQQILGALVDRFVLFAGLAILAVSHGVDHAAKGGHDMEQIEDDLGCRQFFLTALM